MLFAFFVGALINMMKAKGKRYMSIFLYILHATSVLANIFIGTNWILKLSKKSALKDFIKFYRI